MLDVDGLGGPFDEAHADLIEQFADRRGQLVGVRLVEAWTHTQFGLRRQHRHLNVIVAVDIEQASSAQSGPHATKTCANYQDALFHF
ncbi:hypothetical protein D3C72_2167070 [compost metagenome]